MPCTVNSSYDFDEVCSISNCTGNCESINGNCQVTHEYMCNNHQGRCGQQNTFEDCISLVNGQQQQICTWSANTPLDSDICMDPNVVVANGCAIVAGGQPLFRGDSNTGFVTTNYGTATTGDIIRIRPREVEHISSGIKVPLVDNTAGCFSLCLDYTGRSCPPNADYCSTNCYDPNTVCQNQQAIGTPYAGCGPRDMCLQLRLHNISGTFPGIGQLIDCAIVANPPGNFKFYNVGTIRGSKVCYYLTFQKALERLQTDIRYYDNITLRALKSEGWYIGEIVGIESTDVIVINHFGERHVLNAMNVYIIDDFWEKANKAYQISNSNTRPNPENASSNLYQQVFYNDGDNNYGPLTLGTRVKFTEQNITKVGVIIAFNKLSGIALKNTCPSSVSVEGPNNTSTDVGTATVVTDNEEIHTFSLSSKTIKFLHNPRNGNQFVERYGTTACGIKGIWGYEEDAKKRYNIYTGIYNSDLTVEGQGGPIPWDIDLDFYFLNIDLGTNFSSHEWISSPNSSNQWYNVIDFNRFEGYEGVQAGRHQHMCINENNLKIYYILGSQVHTQSLQNTPANKATKVQEVLRKMNSWPSSTTPPSESTSTNQYEVRWHTNGCLQMKKKPLYSPRSDVKIACCATNSNFVLGHSCDPALAPTTVASTPTSSIPTLIPNNSCVNILQSYCQSSGDAINSNICNLYGSTVSQENMSVQNSITSYCQNRSDCSNIMCTNTIFGMSSSENANGSDYRCSSSCNTTPYNFYNCPNPEYNMSELNFSQDENSTINNSTSRPSILSPESKRRILLISIIIIIVALISLIL